MIWAILLATLWTAVSKETESELKHKNDFIAFDLNHDGFVDASEVRQQFSNLSQKEISAFFIAAD